MMSFLEATEFVGWNPEKKKRSGGLGGSSSITKKKWLHVVISKNVVVCGCSKIC